jgi:hypothetical protein
MIRVYEHAICSLFLQLVNERYRYRVSGIGQYWVVSGGIGIGDTKPDTLTDTMM